MATAKKQPGNRIGKHKAGSTRLWPRLLLGVAVLVAGTAWYFRAPVMERAIAGTSYGARVGCSCRFIGGRSLGDCEKDFLPGMELISLSEDPEGKSVTASIFWFASQTATYREGYGCVLEEWDG